MGQGGSSPRSRGTRLRSTAPCRCRRFIPAVAGNTNVVELFTRVRSVHPRGRGEHGTGASTAAAARGSSPRSRGTHCRQKRPHSCFRFIPAVAGNTESSRRASGGSAVHPRGRGEHLALKRHSRRLSGSSPRSRGTLCLGQSGEARGRFIPAVAGNT